LPNGTCRQPQFCDAWVKSVPHTPVSRSLCGVLLATTHTTWLLPALCAAAADMLEVQPASPKYDERSFFFSGVGTALVRPTPLATASRTLSARSPLLPPSGALAAAAAAGGGVAGGVGASPASAAAAAMLGPSAQPLPQQLEELEGFAVQPQQYRPGRGSSSQEGGASTSRQAAGDDTPKQSGGASEGQPTAEGPPAAEPGAGGGHIQARQQLLATGLKPLKTAAGEGLHPQQNTDRTHRACICLCIGFKHTTTVPHSSWVVVCQWVCCSRPAGPDGEACSTQWF
jgi:hypothetical protein